MTQRWGEVLRMTLGAFVIYAVMAMCADAEQQTGRRGSSNGGTSDVVADGIGDVETGADGAIGDYSSVDTSGSEGSAFEGLSEAIDALLDPVPEVLADEVIRPGDRLQPRVMNGADGSRQLWQWWDTERGESCYFQVASDGQYRCLPMGHGINDSYYLDPGCSQRIALTQKGTCPGPDALRVATLWEQGCPASVRVFEIGVLMPSPSVYQKNDDGSCTANDYMTESQTYDIFSVGPEIPPTAFVAGALSVGT